jgi:toxin ParE1/3/4
MKILWSPIAIEHLFAARAHIARDNPSAAERIAAKILFSVENLAQHPHLGRPGRVAGTRELGVPDTPYILPYRIHKNCVEVIAVFHGSQRWPELL